MVFADPDRSDVRRIGGCARSWPGGTGEPPMEILSDLVPGPRTEILVLAMTHLRSIGDAWNPHLVESLDR